MTLKISQLYFVALCICTCAFATDGPNHPLHRTGSFIISSINEDDDPLSDDSESSPQHTRTDPLPSVSAFGETSSSSSSLPNSRPFGDTENDERSAAIAAVSSNEVFSDPTRSSFAIINELTAHATNPSQHIIPSAEDPAMAMALYAMHLHKSITNNAPRSNVSYSSTEIMNPVWTFGLNAPPPTSPPIENPPTPKLSPYYRIVNP